jgi:hypothetical protein
MSSLPDAHAVNAAPRPSSVTPAGETLLLALSLAAGLAYPFVDGRFGTIADIVLKGAGVGLLAIAALRNTSPGFRWLGAILGFGALGDVLLEVPGAFMLGAGGFAVGHCLGIGFYGRNRRAALGMGDRLAAAALILFGLAMPTLVMPAGAAVGPLMLYSVLLCGMAAALNLSRFARPWAGIGALLFVVSDTFLIMRLGGTLWGGAVVHGLIVWFTYYFGQALIFIGVARALRA